MMPTMPASAARPSPRAVVTAVFFAFAIGLGLWAGSIPALMRQTGLDVAGLGLAITLHTGAYIAAMAGGGQLARHIPPRRLALLALLALVPCFGALFTASSPLMLMAAFTAVGLSAGLLDLAMNAEGTAVEHDLGWPVLLSMHAAASGAFALGALAGSLIATHGGPPWCALVVGVVALPVALAQHRLGPRLHAPVPSLAVPQRGGGLPPGIVRIGIVLGLTIGAEMAAQMWSARFLERQAAELAAFAGAGAAFFAGFQSVVRLFGDPLRRRLGDDRVIVLSLIVAALGFVTVATSAQFAQSLLGFALVGLGTACVVPCCFALAARRAAAKAAAALGLASLIAGSIRLPAPMVLGAAAAAWSDAIAFAGVAGGLLIALVLAWQGRREAPTPRT
jgi:MFS family permease